MKNLIALLALGAVYYFAQAKNAVENFKVKFLDSKLDFARTRDSGFSRVFFTIKLRVRNESDFKGEIKKGFILVSYNGRTVGKAEATNAIEVEPRQEFEIKIPAELETLKLVSSIPQMWEMLTASRQIKFHLKGKLFFNIGEYTINQEYKVHV